VSISQKVGIHFQEFLSSWGAYDIVEDSKSFQFHWIHVPLERTLLVLRTPFSLAQQDEGGQLQLQVLKQNYCQLQLNYNYRRMC